MHINTSTSPEREQQTTSYTGEIPKTPLRFLWYTAKPYWVLLGLGLFFNITAQLLAAYTAFFIGDFTTAATTGLTTQEYTVWAIWFVAISIIFYASFRAAGFTAIHFTLKQHAYAFDTVREHLLQHSHTYFSNRFSGTLARKVFHAGDRSGELLLMSFYGLVRLITGLVSAGVIIALFSGWLAIIYFVILLFAVVLNIFLVRRRRPHVVAYANATSRYRGQLTDVTTNIQAVRQYAAIAAETKWLGDVQEDRITKDYKQWMMAEWNHLINNLLTAVILISMVVGTYVLLIQDLVAVGAMVTVMILMYRISGILVDLGDWMNRFIRVYGETEEGLDDIFIDHEIVDSPSAQPLAVTAGQIDWHKVSFKYESERIFNDFNLTIPAGQRLGLVGPSGAGKTTFVSLLLRQHELSGGTISIDVQPIHEVTQDSLRAAIAVVPQEPALFHRTIRENIAYGKPDATDDEIIAVAKDAHAHEFIATLSEGYDTLVGERGVKLSGGQKQRIAIARAMLKNAPILVLDEATSALDSESEVAIQEALQTLMTGKTVIAIAHRLSTLREMDRIIVLESGQIVEDGNHATLKQTGGTYARLWSHQAGGFVGE